MTTGEWIATVIGSNAFTLGLATFITNIMIKSSESKAKTANGIIVNPMNGDILAMSTLPSFNPNKYYDFEIKRR